MISRRFVLGGAAALAATGLVGCATGVPAYDGPPVTQVVVQKGARRLYLLGGGTVLKAYDVELGSNPVGHKLREGDGRTPEGAYRITHRNPRSDYHLSVGISYPDVEDVARARALGVPPGGSIFIHGTPRHMARRPDWTAGCIAVTNREIEEVYAMVRPGTPIAINA